MATEFPYVEIPREMAKVIGKREGDSRVYAREGSQEECAPWYDVLHEIVGPCVSPGGVAMYCPVSRAATHRRIREGRLSCFTYKVKERKIDFFGKLRGYRDTPYQYVPVSECKAWRKELEEKAVRNERVTQEQLEGATPDWSGEFLDWDSRWRKEQRKLGGPRTVNFTIKLSKKEVEAFEETAKNLGMENGGALAIMILGDVAHSGLSGLSFVKLGAKMSRLIEQSGKGEVDWKQLLPRS